MEKNYKSIKLFILLLYLLLANLRAQNCIQQNQYPSSTVTVASSGTTNIASCIMSGQYSVFNFTASGAYNFSASGSVGYLTVTDNLNTPIASGYSPLGVLIPSVGIYRCHVSTGPNCSTTGNCHFWTVSSSAFCSSIIQYPTSTNQISVVGITTITTCNYAGEYSVNNFSVAGIYTVNAVGGTANYITVKNNSGNVVYAQGNAPLAVNIPYAGLYNIHVASSGPGSCGTESTCRVVTVLAPPSNQCPGTPQASNALASSTMICSGGGFGGFTSLSLSNSYTAAGIFYQWAAATNSVGPYVSIPNATLTTYSALSLPNTTWFNCVITCTNAAVSSTAAAIQVSVNPTPTAAITAPSVICSGQSLNLVGSTNIGTNFLWIGPSNFTSNIQSPTLTNIQTSSSGSYAFIVSTANCTNNAVSMNININSTPSALTLTPVISNICSGSSTTLTVNGGQNIKTLEPGTQNQLSSYPAPYNAYYGGQRMQVLVLAAELFSAGFTANTPLTSISFPVASKGSNWGTSIFDCKNFQVSVGTTTLTTLPTFQSGLTVVSTASNYTPSIGYGNTHYFAPSFNWNGIDNLIFETTFSNNTAGTSSDQVIQYKSNTPTIYNPFIGSIVYYADNKTAAAVATSTYVTLMLSERPDFKINGFGLNTYSWNPSSSLSSATGSNVVATPISTTIYTVNVNNGNCGTSNSVAVNVTATPTLSILSNPTVCAGSSLSLAANGASSYTWGSGATASSITTTPSVNTTYSVIGANGTCTNSAVKSVTVNALPNVSILSNSTVCAGSSLNLAANGANTYTWDSGATTTSIVVTPPANTTYSVIGSNGTCTNSAIKSVTVNALPPVALTVNNGTVCVNSGTITLSGSPNGGVYSGTGVTGNVFTTSTTGTFTPIYSFTNTSTGCANTASSSIVVSICTDLNINSTLSNIVNVYPNPNNGLFTVQWNNGLVKTITVLDITGRSVLSYTSSNDTIEFNISNLANGVYYLNIVSNNSKQVLKVVKH